MLPRVYRLFYNIVRKMLCVSWLYSMVGGWPDVRIIIIVVVEYKNNEIIKK